MATSRPRPGKLRRTSPCCVLVLRLGLSMVAPDASPAQDVRGSVTPVGRPLTISVASNVAQSCAPSILGSVVQQDIEAQLRGAGISVSNVHNAGLATEVDCVPAMAGGRLTGISVHQCLSLSQSGPSPSQGHGVTLVTTWRKCQSYTCGKRNCAALIRSKLRSLVGAFLTDAPTINSAHDMLGQPARPRQQVSETNLAARELSTAERRSSQATEPIPYTPSTKPALGPYVIYYLLYILMCLAVLALWEYWKHQHG